LPQLVAEGLLERNLGPNGPGDGSAAHPHMVGEPGVFGYSL
jgi:hypothetical protein